MKNLLCLLLFAASTIAPGSAQVTMSKISPDTFRIQNFPLKIWHGNDRVRKLNAAQPLAFSKNDAKIRLDWNSGKSIRNVGLGVQAAGLLMIGAGFFKTLKADEPGGGTSLVLGGALVELGGVAIQLVGVGKIKKAMRRYNGIQAGRIEAIPVIFKQPAEKEKTAAPPAKEPETREKPAPEKQRTATASNAGRPAPKARFVNSEPRNRFAFFRDDSTASLKPDAGDWGFGIKAAGLKGLLWENSFDSLTFQIRKTRGANLILRADFSLLFQSQKDSHKDVYIGGGYDFRSDSERRFAFGIAPGIEKHFPGTRRLDPYVGASLPLVFAGKFRSTSVNDDVSSTGSYTKRETETTLPGGFGIGLDGFAGLNYFVGQRLAIGIEYNVGFSFLRIGGKAKYKNTVKTKPSATAAETTDITENEDDEDRFSTAFFGNKGVAGLNLIFYLGRGDGF